MIQEEVNTPYLRMGTPPARPITATFIRHAQSVYNVVGYCNDDPAVPVELTAHGRREARVVARRLVSEPFDTVIVSQFPRAIETARILNTRQVPMRIDQRLNDRKTGFEGRPVAEFAQAITQSPARCRMRGTETYREHKRRVVSFLDDLRKHSRQRVLVVSHHDPLRVVIGQLLGLSDNEARNLCIPNCEGFRAVIPPEGPLRGSRVTFGAVRNRRRSDTHISRSGLHPMDDGTDGTRAHRGARHQAPDRGPRGKARHPGASSPIRHHR